MNAPFSGMPHAEPFFFDAEPGTRFCLYHAPDPRVKPRGGILYIHPFAEELNKSRRTAALQARAFASVGYAVLQVDLFGCGDSCGDFSSARWDIWQSDLEVAFRWLHARVGGPMYLWGLRLGALMALDFACATPVEGIILWQPFVRGRTCINQFLRARLATELLVDGIPVNTTALRDDLYGHGFIEINGYELSAELARAIDARDAAAMVPRTPRVDWFATGTPDDGAAAAMAARIDRRWPDTTLRFHHVAGPAFWATRAIADSPALLDATTRFAAPERI